MLHNIIVLSYYNIHNIIALSYGNTVIRHSVSLISIYQESAKKIFERNATKRTNDSCTYDRLMEHIVNTGLQQC